MLKSAHTFDASVTLRRIFPLRTYSFASTETHTNIQTKHSDQIFGIPLLSKGNWICNGKQINPIQIESFHYPM